MIGKTENKLATKIGDVQSGMQEVNAGLEDIKAKVKEMYE